MNKIYITQEQLSKLQESFSEAPFEKDEFTIGDDGNGNMGYFHIEENIQTEITPSEVDLSSFEIQHDLNQDVWQEGDMLDSRVRLTLLDIADDFYDSLKLKWLKPLDIVLTGSICNFNWSEFSDIDMHIIVDFS